jgi:hypothetical protein
LLLSLRQIAGSRIDVQARLRQTALKTTTRTLRVQSAQALVEGRRLNARALHKNEF